MTRLSPVTGISARNYAFLFSRVRACLADKLAGEAVLGEAVPLDAATVIATLTEWYNNNRVVAPSHTLDVLKEKKYKRGEGRKCDLRGAARRIHNQLLTETISIHTLKKTLEARSSQLWTSFERDDGDERKHVEDDDDENCTLKA